jgi:hyperosmotically inducible periplasmic protein
MKTRTNSLLLGMALAAATSLLVSGCNRQEPVPPGAAPPAKTTVGTEIDDTVVTTKVKSALLNDQEVKGLGIKVETRKGMVQLSGFADSQAQVDRVISVAKAVEGVAGVENGLTLKQGTVTVGNKVDDGIVTAKVKSALLSDPGVKGFDIAVATSKGEVQLSGFVDNQMQIDHAIEVARGVEGVQGVDNQMSVKK